MEHKQINIVSCFTPGWTEIDNLEKRFLNNDSLEKKYTLIWVIVKIDTSN